MNISKKIAALAVAGAILASGALVASSAQAAPISGATLTITPLSGNVNTDTVFLNTLDINVTAPAGFQAAGGTFVYQGGVELGNVSSPRTPSMSSSYGTTGLDGSLTHLDRVISPTNNFLSSKLLSQLTTPLATGHFELRSYYFASATSPNRATDPYVTLDMTYDATTGAWAVFVPATATTTSLTASAAASVVTLTATVAPAAAAGSVAFMEGTTTVATSTVAAGVATATLSAVADGQHVYTAVFTPTSATYSGSTSGTATVQVGGITATSTITTTIPSGVGTLTLTGVSSSVALGTAALQGGVLYAHGALAAKVTDSRQLDYPAWSLTGQVSDFTKTGGTILNGKYLGWVPTISGTATGSAAGAIVEPSPVSVNGLKTISTLATGAPSAAGTITDVSADLQLKAPSNTPAGAYSATLTLTLI